MQVITAIQELHTKAYSDLEWVRGWGINLMEYVPGQGSKEPFPTLVELARTVHDACLGSMTFGWFPPLRGSCITKCLHPSHVADVCPEPGCTRPGCKGNRLEMEPVPRLVMPHHKTNETE